MRNFGLLGLTVALGVLTGCAGSDFAGGSAKKKSEDEPKPEVPEDDPEPTDDDTEIDTDGAEEKPKLEEEDACAQSAFIDFESVPGVTGDPEENLEITDQFKDKYGVTFGEEGGGSPRMAKVESGKSTAFSCNSADCTKGGGGNESGWFNGLRPGQEKVGKFFLYGSEAFASNPKPLTITYDEPTAKASGAILDIDGTEKWTVVALGESGDELEKVELGSDDDVYHDGMQTFFKFEREQADIKMLKLVGSSNGAFGLGSDNFSVRGVCEVN